MRSLYAAVTNESEVLAPQMVHRLFTHTLKDLNLASLHELGRHVSRGNVNGRPRAVGVVPNAIIRNMMRAMLARVCWVFLCLCPRELMGTHCMTRLVLVVAQVSPSPVQRFRW